MLSDLELAGNLVAPNGAEPEIDARTEHGSELVPQGDRPRGVDGQKAGRWQLPEAAIEERGAGLRPFGGLQELGRACPQVADRVRRGVAARVVHGELPHERVDQSGG